MRQWLPNLAELVDRLSIHQLKEVMIPEHKEKYASEMRMIISDLEEIIHEQDIKLTGDLIAIVIAISQVNAHIWYNESKVRSGHNQDVVLLKLTHGLNGIRNQLMNKIASKVGDARQDYKVDCLAAEFKDWYFSILE